MMTDDQNTSFDPPEPIRVGVVGLGLIGGSLAKALASRAKAQVVGIDPDPAVIAQALADQVLVSGAVMSLLPENGPENRPASPRSILSVIKPSSAEKSSPESAAQSAAASEAERANGQATAKGTPQSDSCWSLLAACSVVFLCTPPATIPALVRAIRPMTAAILTDVASVKQPVLDLIDDNRFVGGHPMAGSEKHGYANASEILFENAVYVLCLPEHSAVSMIDFRHLETLIFAVGATPLCLDARVHDKAVAAVSHLPHVAAAALSLLAARQADGTLTRLAAGGFRDITRIASSDAGLWSAISLESRYQLLPLIDQYIAILEEFRDELQAEDINRMRQYFFQASQYRGSLPVDGRGALLTQSALNVYIPDQVGIIGKVTTLLGEHAINITNLRIREFRTYEGGCLQLLLPDSAQAARAAWLLKEAGYECD